MNTSKKNSKVHYLPAIHAYRENYKHGCPPSGTKNVSMTAEFVTCKTCLFYYWRIEGIQLSEEARKYVQSLEN
jgi:hypothetical protein